MHPGQKLKDIRNRLGLSMHEVERLSQIIVDRLNNQDFHISTGWLTQIENDEGVNPSIYKLFSLACIFGLDCVELLLLYGIDLGKVLLYHTELHLKRTHLVEVRTQKLLNSIPLPLGLFADFDLKRTTLLSRVAEKWGSFPLELVRFLDFRKRLYGYVGSEDDTLSPIIKPGSFVEIDPTVTKISHTTIHTEDNRPIYFLDLREAYAFGWCEISDGKLLLLAHPHSKRATRVFTYPQEVDVVGQVVGVLMRLA
jgi:transcriptional regulator with XRE-family HTH domain